MDWLGRADIIVLALMLLCVIVTLGRCLYGCHLAQHQTHTFLRNAAVALQSGEFDAASRFAEPFGGSPVAAMVATWVATVTVDSTNFSVTESTGVASRAFWRSQKKLASKFIFGLGTLQSIAHTAPFLGLAGACELIMNGAFRGYEGETHSVMLMLITGTATSLVSTVMGLLVAIPASWSYNYLRERVGMLDSEMSKHALNIVRQLNAHFEPFSQVEHMVFGPRWHKPWKLGPNFQFAQNQPLGKRFSDMPAYGLLAAPGLTFVMAAFTIFPSFYPPTGLSLRLLKSGEVQTSNNSSNPVIVIRSASTNAKRRTVFYVNAKETPWEKLDKVLKSKIGKRASQQVTYVEAGDDVPWQAVADVIDVIKGVSGNVVLLTNRPRAQSSSHTGTPRAGYIRR
jgi:biopolymer transport protein ExbB/TolQ/biopolymer transport protein ExbD